MRGRGRIGLLGTLIAIAASAPVALAGWGPNGVTVRPTTSWIPVVAACSDGATGTYVAWHEGQLRVNHLLATGDLDPDWPADGVPLAS